MFKASCFIATLTICLLMTACEGQRTTTSGGDFFIFTTSSDNPLPIKQIDARERGYGTSWIRDLQLKRGHEVKSVAVLEDVVVTIEVPNNIVSAMSLKNGKFLWRKPVGSDFEILFGPARYDDTILVNSETRMYHLDIKDGDIEYATKLDYPVSHAPALVRNYAVFGSRGGRAYAHDLVAGFAKWEHDLTGEIRVPPVATDFDVFIADARGVYKMFKADDGALLWDGKAFAPIVAPPVVTSTVYVASMDQTLYALDRTTGDERWTFTDERPLRKSPAAFGRYVFQPLGGGGLVALSATNGNELWRIDDDVHRGGIVIDSP